MTTSDEPAAARAAYGPATAGGTVPVGPHAAATVLDNPVVASLDGPQARFAERLGVAARFSPAVAPFVGLPRAAEPAAWTDLAALVGGQGFGALVGDDNPVADGWTVLDRLVGVQLVAGPDARGERDDALVTLGEADVDEMLALTAATKPGPFFTRTHELGHYHGLREGGELVAMAGERMHPAGFVEISAVCTAPSQRGRGLASRMVRHLMAEIVDRGEVPFLHAVSSNVGAIRLYESLGFALRRPIAFTLVTVPGAPDPRVTAPTRP